MIVKCHTQILKSMVRIRKTKDITISATGKAKGKNLVQKPKQLVLMI